MLVCFSLFCFFASYFAFINFMQRRLLIGFVLSFLFFGLYVFYQSYAFIFFVKDQQLIKLTLKKNFFASVQKELTVEVATTQVSISKGLSSRVAMESSNNQKIDGLLFIFPKREIRHFWMKEMLFDLDICWLTNLIFISCQRAVRPAQADQDLDIYSSKVPVNLVLETEPGFFSEEELNLKLFFQW